MNDNERFDKEYNISLQKVMALVDDKKKDEVTVYISDGEELQSIMMLVCSNYKLKFERTEKEKSYVT